MKYYPPYLYYSPMVKTITSPFGIAFFPLSYNIME